MPALSAPSSTRARPCRVGTPTHTRTPHARLPRASVVVVAAAAGRPGRGDARRQPSPTPPTSLTARLGSAVTAAALAAALALGAALPPPDTPAAAALEAAAITTTNAADEETVPPPSSDPALFAVQRTLYTAWDAVDRGFVDASFGGRDWRADLRAGLKAVGAAPSPAAARAEIGAMVSRLGDPYTRIVPGPEYADFQLSAAGEVQGVGLLVAADPSAGGRLVVVAPLDGSPAARAGVRPGDRLLDIDDHPLPPGTDSAAAAALLRGAPGSAVTLRVARAADADAALPGVARRAPGAPQPLPPIYSVRTFALTREAVELSPVTATAVPLPGGHGTAGYIRLASFTSRSAADVARAVADLDAAGARAYVLDLRGNPGGLVRAALGVARLWLAPASPVFNVVGRDDAVTEHVVLEGGEWDDDASAGPSHTNPSPPPASVASSAPPLAVLVDHGSASAAEILAGALRDNGRASVIGDRTFGKGAIQAVVPLGSEGGGGGRRGRAGGNNPDSAGALMLTVARYTTPAGTHINGVGLRPARACKAGRLPPAVPMPRLAVAVPGAQEALASALEADPCMRVAAGVLASQL